MYIKTQALQIELFKSTKETTSDDTDRCLHLKMLHIKTGLSTKSRGSYNLSFIHSSNIVKKICFQ